MKNYFMFCLLAISFCFMACEKNPCKEVDCGIKGICNGANGECVCLDGYTKDADGKCTVAPVAALPRDKYIGTYTVTEQGVGASATAFTVTISKGTDNAAIILTGHAGYQCGATQELVSLNGEVYTNGNLSFPSLLRFCGSNQYEFSGFYANDMINNTFSANYTVQDYSGILVKNVTATFVKQ